MTKMQILLNIQDGISGFQSAMYYSYIAGSYDTEFFTKQSDLDIMLVWKTLPSQEIRLEVLAALTKAFSLEQDWIFLDKEGPVFRDAIKLKNFRKLEVYHYDIENLQKTLELPEEDNGLSFNLSKRVSLQESPELNLFIDSYGRTEDLLNDQKKVLYFSIMAHLKESKSNSDIFAEIIYLYSLNEYGAVPAQKHWAKLIQSWPNSELLVEGRYNEWIVAAKNLIAAWAGIYPSQQITVSEQITIKKTTSVFNELVLNIIQSQRTRLSQFLNWPASINSMDDQNKFSDRALQQWQRAEAFHFQIFYENKFAGAVSLHSFDFVNRSFEFGYWVSEEFQGKGLISQSLTQLIRHMSLLGWKRALIRAKASNERSTKIADKLNMKPVAEIKKGDDLYVVYST